MKTVTRRCKCQHCQVLFLPNYRKGQRQRFCSQPDCRKASKRHSQQQWLAKPKNQIYFRDAENAERVRQWQKDHPGYWKNTARYRSRTLKESCAEQLPAALEVTPRPAHGTLQDLCSMHLPLLVGLISMLVDSTLPEDIATSTQRLVTKGHNILGALPGMNPERLTHEKTSPQSGTTPESSPAV
jgi:hypothetical protein